jgi:hypothetical protein
MRLFRPFNAFQGHYGNHQIFTSSLPLLRRLGRAGFRAMMGAALLPEAQRTKDAGGDGFRYGLSGAPARRSHQRRDGEMQSFSGTLRKRSGAVLRH